MSHECRFRGHRRTMLGWACLMACSGGALAQTAALPEVKVSAETEREGAAQGYRPGRVRQLGPLGDVDLLDTPFSISVTPRELIENLQASKPEDVFRYNPVVQVTGPQSRFFTSLTLRGFSVGSTRRIDGIPNTTSYVNLDLEDKERVEVLTGLSGFLYGSGNVGGTVNYVVKRPTYQPLRQITAGITEGSNLRLHADLGGRLDAEGRFAYRLNVVGQDGDTATDRQAIRRGLVSAALDWNLTDQVQLQFEASRSHYRMRGTEPYWAADAGVPYPSAPAPDRFYGQAFSSTVTTQDRFGARLNWRLGTDSALRAGFARHESTIDLVVVNNTFAAGPIGSYRVQGSAWEYPDVDALGGFALFDHSLRTGSVQHKFTLGWFGDRDERTNFRSSAGGWATLTSGLMNVDAPVQFADPGLAPAGAKYRAQRSRFDNFVLGDQVTFNEAWSALVGLTSARIKDTSYAASGAVSAMPYSDRRVTPSLAVLFKPQPAMTLYASYMESLEKGGTAPLVANGVALVNAGAAMPPLMSEQFEVGAKAELGGMLLTGALFHIDKGLQYTDSRVASAPVYVQDGRQVHQGLEFTASGRATRQLALWGGLTLMDARMKENVVNPALEGKTPANVAERMAKLYAEYDLAAVPGLTLTGGISYTGRQQLNTDNTDSVPGFTLLDAGLRYQLQAAGKPWVLRLGVNNLANKAYWLSGNYVGKPRTVAASVQVNL
ncbi:TonB-dependent siderophore receptor [Pseudorhodoferax sp. LjRoot39]|uniref:TonB-dependent receptor n=1 Tax=Pseudorhodoferax sp. LjRoot39 TaxID=3342328 RepID=UPI003ECEF66B